MPVTVVVGGQYGSEGKGKVAKNLAEMLGASVAVRCGGTNSGHTVIDSNGNPIIFRQLPTACLLNDVACVLVAGSYIDVQILLDEIKTSGINPQRVKIDPYAVIITSDFKKAELGGELKQQIGSTASGTGEAVLQRIKRDAKLIFAKDIAELQPFLTDTKSYLRDELNKNNRVIIEGTQGYGLSLLHSNNYPYVTSRDTTASGFLSEAGLSPLDVDDIVLVIRAFPIRVPGNSGQLQSEVDWDVVTNESNSLTPIVEYTSVTKSVRRVGRFDGEVVLQAIDANSPTRIVLNHLDYIDKTNDRDIALSDKISQFIAKVENMIGKKIDFIGCSPIDIQERFPVNLIKGVTKDA